MEAGTGCATFVAVQDIIYLLPDSVANQIAAGEVVQRPASVVKELLENGLDAGATVISLIIKDAGKTLIQVVDNGKGMSYNDARACFDRHATSKLRSADDLFNLRTMGFRGEAMASIAAVAQVELKTAPAHAEVGTLISIEGSEVKKHEAVACAQGTSVAVRNLFFNVPVRRNFLKSNPVETKYIIEEFTRVALANPDISFNLFQNDEQTMKLVGGKLSHRIVELFGSGYREQLVPCEEEIGTMRLRGYIGKPEFARRTRGEQYLFVNDRFVRNPLLHSIILKAYDALLTPDTHPFYVLKLHMDPTEIDVNVHPTKTEIKFQHEPMVCSLVGVAVKHSLATFQVAPSLDFDLNVNQSLGAMFSGTDALPGGGTTTSNGWSTNVPSDLGTSSSRMSSWQLGGSSTAFGNRTSAKEREAQFFLQSPPGHAQPAVVALPGMQQYVTVRSGLSKLKNQTAPALTEVTALHTLLPVLGQYLVKIYEQGLMLVSVRNALERIVFDRLQRQFEHPVPGAQATLFQKPIDLSPADFQLAMEIQGDLAALGLVIEPFGAQSLVVRSLPADFHMTAASGAEVLEELLENMKSFGTKQPLPHKERMLRSLAKQQASRTPMPQTREEQDALIQSLLSSSLPNYTPDGKPTMMVLDAEKLEQVLRLNQLS